MQPHDGVLRASTPRIFLHVSTMQTIYEAVEREFEQLLRKNSGHE